MLRLFISSVYLSNCKFYLEKKIQGFDTSNLILLLQAKYSAENYVAHIQKALDHLHANVPRAFVNLVQILDIAIVKRLNANFVCDTLHLYVLW